MNGESGSVGARDRPAGHSRPEASASNSERGDRADARGGAAKRPPETARARALFWGLSAVYFVFAGFFVPRLTNFVHGDREFTGWTAPIAERMARGERIYEDFVLPIPPGSFALLAMIQRAAGRATLLQELWVASLSYWVMGAIGYLVATLFASRRVAVLVLLSTLVLVTETPKECVYDHTSLVVAWLSVLAGAHALLARSPGRRAALFGLTGFLATATLGFKQSTATGTVLGWGTALCYVALVELRRGRMAGFRARLRDAAWAAGGGVMGLLAVLGLLAAVGARVRSFVQAVLIDGPGLKGGAKALAMDLVAFTLRDSLLPAALVPLGVIASLTLSMARTAEGLHIGAPPPRAGSLGVRSTVLLAVLVVGAFAPAVVLLASPVRGLDQRFAASMDDLRMVSAYGFLFGALFFGVHLSEQGAASDEARERGHAFNATFLAAAITSFIYCISFVRFEPFYYPVPYIPLVLVSLFVATERSGSVWATPLVAALCVLPTYGTKLSRALSDDVTIRGGYWDGLRVNYRGVQLVQAAKRAQELAGPTGTVLVLPEDLQLVGLVDRPRPKVKGAVLFVDQYARRLLAEDVRELDRNPPDVLIIHPRRRSDWERLFHVWSEDSATEKLLDHVLSDLLPKYERDSTYPTIYVWDQGQLDVYVRKDRVSE